MRERMRPRSILSNLVPGFAGRSSRTMPRMEAHLISKAMNRRVVAIVPVGSLEGAKSRLGESLDAEERRDLVTRLLLRTLDATARTPGIDETIVVTPDDEVRALASTAGARPIRQRSQGLNRGLREAREEAIAGGANAVIVLPIDLPLVSPEAIADVLAPLEDPRRPLVVIAPD